MKTKVILFTLALAGITAPAVRADLLDINITGDIRLGRRPPPPAVVVIDNRPQGSSPWERGRWNQRAQGYYYYPGDNVYYRQSDRVWFYQDRGQWRSARSLPPGLSIDFNRSITLNMFTNRPYDYQQQIVARYPANYFGTRVRLRDDDRHDRDDHGRDRDNNDHRDDKDHRNDKDDHRDDRDKR